MTTAYSQIPADSDLKEVQFSKKSGISSVLGMRKDPFGFQRKREEEFGRVSGMSAFGKKWVVASGAPAAEEVLMNKKKAFANGPAWSYLIGPFFNRGVMLLDFDEHRSHRLILQQGFSTAALKSYMDLMQPMIAKRMQDFPTGKVLLFKEFKALTLDVALEVFLGLELPKDEADRINKAFLETVQAGVAVIRKPVPGTRWWKGIRSRKILEEFFYSHIPAKRATATDDLFSVLCRAESEEGQTFTDEDVVNHLIFVLMAAHDTSTISMTQMCYRMAKSPEWLTKAREESMALGAELSYDDLNKLPALDAIFKESLRMCTPVPAHPRMAVEDTEVQGYFVPKGSMVTLTALWNHYDESIYSDPWTFDPDRFSKERAEDKKHRMAWSPFGGGVHKCIGLYFGQMEIKTIMHHLLRNYDWDVPADYELPMDYSSLPIPKDGLPVTLRRL
ncbi:cytochrome P450 [Williamsia phyllosphaerae]|uniref:Cytochrome P450 n=1 Tax=Williamsia phyllosphaerae TaxID=885042 RepID=A0ABQ1UPZ8_9NOCA|nr:cytochrome P450 [Williamsia phyllosphaerae]GGF24385.1 putative cytochrome P450 [Williamsia phyllosphaerae]